MKPFEFINRTAELRELDLFAKQGGLLVVFGRRRVGKTRLLTHWLRRKAGLYSQAIEGSANLQLDQVLKDLESDMSFPIRPRSWAEFLEALRTQSRPWTLCIDEFPYLVAGDPGLPSLLQRWLDHSIPNGCSLILSGSSMRMMSELFLGRSAPLFGRAWKLLKIDPMNYSAFCEATRLKASAMDSFEQYSMVGGVPNYWEKLQPGNDAVDAADSLFFGLAPFMEMEPQRLLRDEGLGGLNPLAVLEAIGRGAHKPSEIGMRLSTHQSNLGRLFQQLLDASIIVRELPFGESVRSTKRILYRIQDPALRFWFGVYSSHRSRWVTYDRPTRSRLIHEHAASVFEDECRLVFPGGMRYWESNLEIDVVAPDPQQHGNLVVGEVKWTRLTARNRQSILEELKLRWSRTPMAAKYPNPRFEVMDVDSLQAIRNRSVQVPA